MSGKKAAIIAFLLIFLATPLFSHTLYMKDGRVIRGRIIAQTRTEVRIEVNGTVATFQKSDIRQVDFEQTVKPTVKPEKQPEKPTEKKAEKPVTPPSKMNRWTVAARSAILPGWGHWAVDERWTGAGYLTLVAGAAGYAVNARSQALSAQSAYHTSSALVFTIMSTSNLTGNSTTNLVMGSLMNVPAYNSFQSRVNTFNNSVRILGAVYGIQLVHAWFSGRSYEQRSQGVAVMPLFDENGRQELGMFYYGSF